MKRVDVFLLLSCIFFFFFAFCGVSLAAGTRDLDIAIDYSPLQLSSGGNATFSATAMPKDGALPGPTGTVQMMTVGGTNLCVITLSGAIVNTTGSCWDTVTGTGNTQFVGFYGGDSEFVMKNGTVFINFITPNPTTTAPDTTTQAATTQPPSTTPIPTTPDPTTSQPSTTTAQPTTSAASTTPQPSDTTTAPPQTTTPIPTTSIGETTTEAATTTAAETSTPSATQTDTAAATTPTTEVHTITVELSTCPTQAQQDAMRQEWANQLNVSVSQINLVITGCFKRQFVNKITATITISAPVPQQKVDLFVQSLNTAAAGPTSQALIVPNSAVLTTTAPSASQTPNPTGTTPNPTGTTPAATSSSTGTTAAAKKKKGGVPVFVIVVAVVGAVLLLVIIGVIVFVVFRKQHHSSLRTTRQSWLQKDMDVYPQTLRTGPQVGTM